jgi:hypothetical protein
MALNDFLFIGMDCYEAKPKAASGCIAEKAVAPKENVLLKTLTLQDRLPLIGQVKVI